VSDVPLNPLSSQLATHKGGSPVRGEVSGVPPALAVCDLAVNIRFEYDLDELATKITTELVHTRNSETYV